MLERSYLFVRRLMVSVQARSHRGRVVCWALSLAALAGCATEQPIEPRAISPGHVNTVVAPRADIPAPVSRIPVLPVPQSSAPTETYTVVVNDVPVKELLFALARDAAVNVDVHPQVEGLITMNAIDQTLAQILDRITRQVDVRYEQHSDTLVIVPDTPFLRTYQVDYVNLSREITNEFNISTQISNASIAGAQAAGGSSDENNSKTEIKSTSNNDFWGTLRQSITSMLEDPNSDTVIDSAAGESNAYVIVNAETGVMMVRATARQHELVAEYLNQVLTSARRQVMIQATIVEVQLNDRYRAGIDFSRLIGGGGQIAASLLAGNLAAAPNVIFSLANAPVGDPKRDTALTVRLLKEFGDVRVLSTPTVMALNNQTAVFRVVENRVFFTVESETNQTDSSTLTTVTTVPHTLPVGLVMSVTPQIAADDEVTLSVRPTITRAIGNGIQDPNPNLALPSFIPQTAVREIESVLRLRSGQVAVLGGLMQDETTDDTDGVPFLSEVQGLGELFKNRDQNYTKTELVIFLKPTVIRNASVDGDLADYRRMLPANLQPAKAQSTFGNDYGSTVIPQGRLSGNQGGNGVTNSVGNANNANNGAEARRP
jgi:MSHA type pilus biogenesis protein MshL